MEEKLIQFFLMQERMMQRLTTPSLRRDLFVQSFGAIQFTIDHIISDEDTRNAIIYMWETEWRKRLEVKAYED